MVGLPLIVTAILWYFIFRVINLQSIHIVLKYALIIFWWSVAITSASRIIIFITLFIKVYYKRKQ